MGEKVLCVKWNHFVPELLAYGSDKGIVRVLQMNENQEFKLTHTFTVICYRCFRFFFSFECHGFVVSFVDASTVRWTERESLPKC
jgi:hypothetical protein